MPSIKKPTHRYVVEMRREDPEKSYTKVFSNKKYALFWARKCGKDANCKVYCDAVLIAERQSYARRLSRVYREDIK